MPRGSAQEKIARRRAPKACQRCSSRKTKCDAAEKGIPCTRCRLDGVDQCAFIHSRRGTYDRGAIRAGNAAKEPNHGPSQRALQAMSTSMRNSIAATSIDSCAPTSSNTIADPDAGPADQPPNAFATAQANSLGSMFEEFLKCQGRGAEELIGKYGIVLLSDSSPLTFAFNELPLDQGRSIYEGTVAVTKEPKQSVVQRQKHPSHLSAADIVYLQAKGAFQLPSSDLCFGLFDAFVEHFYPFHSIFDKEKITQQHHSWTMPWILLYAICVIGASYCPIDLIHQAGLQTRQHCRRIFYDRAKALYDVGYETNRVVLLQAMTLLTYWGPDMKSYWNPCSWIGVAVTIAESLGIHRRGGSKPETVKEERLLRRIWWMLTVRDVYCATLLGRPFRVNLNHCDAPILTIDDFEIENTAPDADDQVHCFYQIEMLKLSLIMRQIVGLRDNSGSPEARLELHNKLEEWMDGLPASLSWSRPTETSNIFSESLKVLWHHHLIFLYMPLQDTTSIDASSSVGALRNSSAMEIAEQAAHMVSTMSLHLVTKSLVAFMPQEVFAGYFVAGIVVFRLIRQKGRLTAQLARAAFDNCRIVLKQVRDCWDSAFWGLQVFDFLVSATAASNVVTQTGSGSDAQNSAGGQHRFSQFEPSSYISPHPGDTNMNGDFDSNFSLGTCSSLLMPMWNFYDQELGFPQTWPDGNC